MQARALTQPPRVESDDDDLDIAYLQTVTGGESRSGQLTGTKALMLAVLEDGIRSYLRGSGLASRDADFWIHSQRRHSPFSFVVVCEVLGLSPEAVRETLKRLRGSVVARRMIPRARHNVRIPGKVYARRA
jgi:hypothetical protein